MEDTVDFHDVDRGFIAGFGDRLVSDDGKLIYDGKLLAYIADDGLPLVDSIMEMQDFWSGKYFNFVEKKVPREQLFDLNVAKEAQARLEKEKPF